MAARIGADDLELFLDPQPELLEEISGIGAEPGGLHVLLVRHGVRSTQRLALSGFGGGFVAALWPAELKPQALYLYGQRLGSPMVARARERGWTAEASPHLAFRNSAPAQRLYMSTSVDAADYVRRWETGDLFQVGQHTRAEVVRSLWPWLKERGYADDGDDAALEMFLNMHLGNRPAYLRPGLRLKRRWDIAAVEVAGGRAGLGAEVRAGVDAILAAAGEPPLPAGDQTAARPSEPAPAARLSVPARVEEPFTDRQGSTFTVRPREPIPERVRHEVWRRDQGRCVECGSRDRLEFDHIIPISKGGSNTARNLELRCQGCNRHKADHV